MTESLSPDSPWRGHLPGGGANGANGGTGGGADGTGGTGGAGAGSFDMAALSAGGTLPAVWHANWTAAPDRDLIHDSTYGWLTAGQIARSVAECVARLAGLGVAASDRVLLSAANSTELVVAHVALLSMGAVVVPINPSYQRAELIHIAEQTQPVLALLGDDIAESWSGWLGAAVAVPSWAEVVSASVAAGIAPGPTQATPTPAALSPTDGALLIFTSGSTGTPKAALLSHANLLASVRSIELAWRWTSDDVLFLTLPLSHMHGLGVGLYGTFTCGARVMLSEGFEAGAALDAIKTHKATMFFGVPTMYTRLLESERVGELAQLRLCVSGSAPLPAPVASRFAELTGLHVLERYGMTETSMLVSNPYEGERRPGTIGFPLPGVQLRLAPGSNEIQVRGPNVFGGYWQADAAAPNEANETAFVDGWFCTGDIGEISDDGYVSIVGRSKEIIISGGYNIHPREVEEAIEQHDAVAQCAVAGEPDDKWGEVVAAYVVLGDEAAGAGDAISLAELQEFLSDRLANYKRPQRFYVLGALPRNAMGKVQRHLLKPPS